MLQHENIFIKKVNISSNTALGNNQTQSSFQF